MENLWNALKQLMVSTRPSMASLDTYGNVPTPPLNVLGGLHDAVVQPIKEDAKDAYWLQRAARERYPTADMLLNFVPYVGTAANLDDIAHDVATKDYTGIPADAAGLGISLATLKGYGNLVKDAAKVAGGRAAVVGGLPLAVYANETQQQQGKQATRYDGQSLKQIADYLRNQQ